MVVSDQSSGQLFKMSMSGMGGHWSSTTNGIQLAQSTNNVGIGIAPDQSYRLKVNGSTRVNGNVDIVNFGGFGSANLSVDGTTTISGNTTISGANLIVEEDFSGNGGNMSLDGNITNQGNLTSGGDVTFANLNSPPGQSNYDMVVIDQSTKQLYKTSMSGIGGHWQTTDVDGDGTDDAVHTSLDIGIGTNAPQSSLHVDGPGDAVTITTDYKLTMQHYNSSYGPDDEKTAISKKRPSQFSKLW